MRRTSAFPTSGLRAAALLALVAACTTSTSPPPAPAPAELPPALQNERDALRAAEATRLAAQLAEPQPLDRRAELLVAARRAQLPDLDRLERALRDAISTSEAEPAAAARAAATLYDHAETPEARGRWRTFALTQQARGRYLDGERATTLTQQQGVTRAMAHRAIRTLADEFVHPIDDAELLAPGAARMKALGLLPDDAALPPVVELGGAIDALLDAAIAAGASPHTAAAELTEGVFEGVDDYSLPIWPAQVAAWQRHHDGTTSGVVGVQLDRDDDGVYVRALVDGGPAVAAGVHVGDRLRGVDDVDDSGDDPLAALAAALPGPDGATVQLRLERAGAPLTRTVTRGTVAQRTVAGFRRQRDGWEVWVAPRIALLTIHAFRPHTLAELDALLPPADQLDGLVLDLRGNRGGDLEAALDVADRFVADGPLLTVSGRVLPERPERWGLARAGDPWEQVPVVVLVDHVTGSSAELVAGALQARGAHVLGERTAGKGTGQVLRVDDELGFAMQFTNLRWGLPDGRILQRTADAARWGLEPDLPDRLTALERFAVGALQQRREAPTHHPDGTPMPYTGPTLDPELPALSADPQIVRAVATLGG